MSEVLPQVIGQTLDNFVAWLAAFGDTSFDHESCYAGGVGRWAKSLYYRGGALGIAAAAPLVFLEAFAPSARRFFHRPMRFPIADAHYAMGHALLFQARGNPAHLRRAIQFLDHLQETRCPGFKEYCWGYPFDWVTRGGIIRANTPLITTTPYAYEAFLQFLRLADSTGLPFLTEHRNDWEALLVSIVRHVLQDIRDSRTSDTASACSYTPSDHGCVINAAAYRAFVLTSAWKTFGDDRCWSVAERNLAFVLEAQAPDGSWPYARDGVRDFVDHFHTCFVLKALAKIHALTGHEGCWTALGRGVDFYLTHLFDATGLPKPFAKAPRLTVYRRELYDCAECINLCLLLRGRFPRMSAVLETVIREIVGRWVLPSGSFRARKLLFGWDNMPMHRWGQSQMFRSLALYYLLETRQSLEEPRRVSVDPVTNVSDAR